MVFQTTSILILIVMGGAHQNHAGHICDNEDDVAISWHLTELFLRSLNILSKIKKITEAVPIHDLDLVSSSITTNPLPSISDAMANTSIQEDVHISTIPYQPKKVKKAISRRKVSPTLSWYAALHCPHL